MMRKLLIVLCLLASAYAQPPPQTGAITALNGSVQFAIGPSQGISFILTGTWSATVQSQISIDGTNWQAVDMYNFSTELVSINTTGNGTFAVSDLAGVSHIRVIATLFTSGTINVTIRGMQANRLQNTKFDGVPGSATPSHAAYVGANDGTNLQSIRATSLSNYPVATTLTARNAVGAAISEPGSRWVVVSTPAVSTQASASIAAETGVRHVVTGVCFSAGSTTAPALTKLNINLRDGASGAGTIIASWTVVIGAATGQNVSPQCYTLGPLVGTTNTAMTLEYSALLTNLFEDVTLFGFNVN